MYQPGQGGGGEQHLQHGYYQQGPQPPATQQQPMPGIPNAMPPAPMSGQMPPPHTFSMPPPGPPPPGPGPFVAPGPPHGGPFIPPQQAYAQPYNPAAYHHHPQQPQPQQHHTAYMPQQPPQAPQAASAAGPSFGVPLNPLGLMAAGNLFSGGQSWGQQYVERMQQRVGYFTGGALHFHFAINKQYVLTKLLMLVAPFLKQWTYTRQPEQMQGGAAFKPPREDVNSPDLYLPLVGLWTYTLLVSAVQAAHGKFKPDNMYPLVWSAGMAWFVHLLVAKAVLRAMALPASVPWLELAAYTGYPFVPICLAIAAGQLAGWWAYVGVWLYGSTCMAVFLVRTMKRVIFQETRGYGRDLTLVNYLLLGLALFQFPYAFYLGVRP
ncbi:hypothetical protein Agub_g10485 [Astrephomene gubernaculifera]|uniref:Uncharacterized protein n=1 Tax=Astrephomene gubernaculifera TaxID=47775 RepID=A0AAD3DXJ1_9CHLO|nr:hypothetical protein Agub_g10485 [Astrephomene gubernaculifera]